MATPILPTTGALKLTTIGSLSGQQASNPTGYGKVNSGPFRLRNYYGQDYDIPTSSQPIKFSNFRGAVNYLRNYTIVAGPYSQYSTGYHYFYGRSETTNYKNNYPAVKISEGSDLLQFRLKGSSTDTNDTFILKNAVITAQWSGYLDHVLSLWMQINNDVVYEQEPVSTDYINISLQQNSDAFFNAVEELTHIDIAPAVKATFETNFSAYRTAISGNNGRIISFNTQTNNMVSVLQGALNVLGSSATYSASYEILNVNQGRIKIVRYLPNSTGLPLCYRIGTLEEFKKQVNYANSAVYTIQLGQYPIQPGTPIEFYLGPGPGYGRNIHKWSNMILTLTVTNNLLPVLP